MMEGKKMKKRPSYIKPVKDQFTEVYKTLNKEKKEVNKQKIDNKKMRKINEKPLK